MRSVTSYFNPTIYRKTMHRNWPLWAVYGLFWLFAIPLRIFNDFTRRSRYDIIGGLQEDMLRDFEWLPDMLQMGVVVAVGYGVLCAMAVFHYLYNNRSVCLMHALPLRRDTLFVTNYLAGISFFLIPHLVTALVSTAGILACLPSASWGAAMGGLLGWLAGQSGLCLFFFSFASVCAMLTGHILALPAFYAIFNALASVIYFLVVSLLENFWYGYTAVQEGALYSLVHICTPAWALSDAVNFRRIYPTDPLTGLRDYEMEPIREMAAPGAVAAYAAAALLLAAAALLLYRARHMESAGDVVAFRVLYPIFRVGVAFCSGLCLGVLMGMFFGWQNEGLALSACVLLWTLVGWFVSEMLLRKSFRVWKVWKGGAVMVCVMALLCAGCVADLFGVESRVPQPGQIQSVEANLELGLPHDGAHSSGNRTYTDPEHIALMVQLHRAVVDWNNSPDRDEAGDDYHHVYITYHLTDGTSFSRRYHSLRLNQADEQRPGTITHAMRQLMDCRTLVAKHYDFDRMETGRLAGVWMDGSYAVIWEKETAIYSITAEATVPQHLADEAVMGALEQLSGQQRLQLWQAVRRDFDEGNLGKRYFRWEYEVGTQAYDLSLYFDWENVQGQDYGQTVAVVLTPGARHTWACLEELGVLETVDVTPDPVLD